MSKPILNIGLIGTGFMGKTHAFGFAMAPRVFDLPYRPVLHTVADMTEDSAARGAQALGFANSTGDWRRMIDTNVMGVLYMTHAALDGMVAQGSGDIVNMSSVAGRQARVGAGVYNASKWAVNAFSESLRQEVTARGVRISLVEPGAVETELRSHITQPEAKAAAQKHAQGMRSLQPEDIARAILYVVTQPPHVAVNEVLVRPTDQER